MSSKKILIISLIVLTAVVVFFVITKKPSEAVKPTLSKQSSFLPQASTESTNQPQEVKYDANTDLKNELEKINPQILDSDF